MRRHSAPLFLGLALAALCTGGIAGCNAPPTDPGFNATATFDLTDSGAGELCTANGECYPNPSTCGCADATIEVDAATGETRQSCRKDDGSTNDDCGELTACITVTAPEPDCVVCAWIGGRVFYSTCTAEDPIVCEYVDRWGTGASAGDAPPPESSGSSGGGSAGGADASVIACAQGGTFRAPDGCNTCSCDADGNVSCTEMACAGCVPGDVQPAGDGCNSCTCLADGTLACTDMACGGACKVCRNGAGETVYQECGNDCSNQVCPMFACADGFIATRLPGECCDTCLPVDNCRDVACPAVAMIACPDGYAMVQDPVDCCSYRCEPTDCSGVMCPALAIDCPVGYDLVYGAPDCCGRCEPSLDCSSDQDCAVGQICSTSLGDCRVGGCGPGMDCPTVCLGVCLDGACAQDNICPDGSLPQGTDCRCPDATCPLDFVCADGSSPQGAECLCPQACLLDFVCQDGSMPQGRDCACPGASGDLCYSDDDCTAAGLTCSVSNGDCQPPPGCDAGMACPAVCTGVCQ